MVKSIHSQETLDKYKLFINKSIKHDNYRVCQNDPDSEGFYKYPPRFDTEQHAQDYIDTIIGHIDKYIK